MKFRNYAPAALVAGLALASSLPALAQSYAFTINPSASGLTANPQLKLATSGSLIGSYNASTNPGGTHTKPGLTGSFGSTENVAVPLSASISATGSAKTKTSGDFTLDFDLAHKRVTVSDYDINFLNSGTVSLSETSKINTSSFRTRVPTFSYPALALSPTGTLTLKSFSVVQGDMDESTGALVADGTNTYKFVVGFHADATASLTLNGASETFTYPTLYTLSGKVVFGSNGTAVVTTDAATNVSFGGNTTHVLTPFPIKLPTWTGSPVNVVVHLTITQASLTLSGSYTLSANGVKS